MSLAQDWNQLTDADLARVIDQAFTAWVNEEDKFGFVGVWCTHMEDKLLWRHLADSTGTPFTSFSKWLSDRTPAKLGTSGIPPKRSTAYAAKRLRKELLDISDTDFAAIPYANLFTMKKLSTAVRSDAAVIEAAKTPSRSNRLVKHVQENHPEQHLDGISNLELRLTEGQRAEIEEAVGLAIARGDATSAEEAIYGWAVDYKQTCRENDAATETVVGRVQ